VRPGSQRAESEPGMARRGRGHHHDVGSRVRHRPVAGPGAEVPCRRLGTAGVFIGHE